MRSWIPLVILACNAATAATVPRLTIVEAPPACCAGNWAGTLAGTASGVDPDSVVVVAYAATDLHYVQPYEDSCIELSPGGIWRTATRGGDRYAALLVRRGYAPAPTLAALPPEGGEVLAIAVAPAAQRRIDFADRTWIVKASGGVPFGPGPMSWSDSEESVWVDAAGRMHLRLAPRDGVWHGAEVFTDQPLGYGRVRFEIATRLDELDPNVVAAGFLYADGGAEIDVEFARWGDDATPHPAQFALQPDRVQPFAWVQTQDPSTHAIAWSPDAVECTSRVGRLAESGGTTFASRWSTDVPVPSGERLHFNLWLHHGSPPRDGLPVEMVIAAVEFETPVAVEWVEGDATRLHVATPSRLPLRGWMSLPRAASYELQLVDVRGRRIARQAGLAHSPRFEWDPGRVAPGVYWLRLQSPAGVTARRVVVPAGR